MNTSKSKSLLNFTQSFSDELTKTILTPINYLLFSRAYTTLPFVRSKLPLFKAVQFEPNWRRKQNALQQSFLGKRFDHEVVVLDVDAADRVAVDKVVVVVADGHRLDSSVADFVHGVRKPWRVQHNLKLL